MPWLAEPIAPLPAYSDEDVRKSPSLFPDYRSTVLRCPAHALRRIPRTLTEATGPAYRWEWLMGEAAADLTAQHAGAPLAQRILVQGRVLDE
jgi:protocatechuate 3,4-dioxygenase beta subunit